MTPEDLVARTKKAISRFGTAYMIDAATREAGARLGLSPLGFYYGGRGGVLGAVHGDVVAAAFAFMPARGVRRFWDEARAVADPAALAEHYAEACADYGRRVLADVDGLERFCTAAAEVVDRADCAGMPLFAGWRALPRAADLPGRSAQLVNLLRELRGGWHVMAALSAGLAPVEAVLADGGPDAARFLGWREPWPEVTDDVRRRREEAEAVTDRLAARDYTLLDDAGRVALAEGVAAIKAAAKAAG